MSLTIQATSAPVREFEIAPAGNHVAICYAMVDLGQQHVVFNNEEKWQRKVYIGWELSNEQMADGRPFMVSWRFTMSLHEKSTLRAILESWRGRPFTDDELMGFDLKNILGKPCMVNVVHATGNNGRTYANVKSIATMPKGMTAPEQINPTMLFEFGDQGFDEDKYLALPQWLQTKISESKDYQMISGTAPVVDEWNDEIEF